VLIYRNYPLEVKNDNITRALVFVHGINRDADNHFRTVLAAAFLAGALNITIIVIAALFWSALLSLAQAHALSFAVSLQDRGGVEQPRCPDQRDVIVRNASVHEHYGRSAERRFDLGDGRIGHGFDDVHAWN